MATTISALLLALIVQIGGLQAETANSPGVEAHIRDVIGPQTLQRDQQREQTKFGLEWEPGDIKKPVEVPDGALQVLRDTLGRGTVNCLRNHGTMLERVPAS